MDIQDIKRIQQGDSGLEARTKINEMLFAIIKGDKGLLKLWEALTESSTHVDNATALAQQVKETQRDNNVALMDKIDREVANMVRYVNSVSGGVSGFATDVNYEPNFPSNKSVTLLAAGAGTYKNFIGVDGRPITITNASALIIMYREAGATYWSYKEIPVAASNITISQTKGASTSSVMSQAAVTTALTELTTQVTQAVDTLKAEQGEELKKVKKGLDDLTKEHEATTKTLEKTSSLLSATSKRVFNTFSSIEGGYPNILQSEAPSGHLVVYLKDLDAFAAKKDSNYYAKWDTAIFYMDNNRPNREAIYGMGEDLYVFNSVGVFTLVGKSSRELLTALDEKLTAMEALKSKTSPIVGCKSILEASVPPPAGGVYLRKNAGGKLSEVVTMGAGAISVTEPKKGVLYQVGQEFYAFNGSHLDLLGASKGGSGDGSGSGFYNVTTEIPLGSGYYTLATALRAMQDAEYPDERKKGAIITFEAKSGVWEDYRFAGTSLTNFFVESSWEKYGAKGAVRSISFSVGTRPAEKKLPNASGDVTISIPEVAVENSVTPNSTNAVQSGAVHSAIHQLKKEAVGGIKVEEEGEGADKVYRIVVNNMLGEEISTEGPITGGGGGSQSATKIILTRVTPNLNVKAGDEVALVYSYDQINTETKDTTGNPAKAVVTITRGATSYSFESDVAAGSTQKIDATKFVGVGTNNIRVRLEVGAGSDRQVASASWTVNVIQLKLTSSYSISTLTERGQSLSIPYALSGSGSKVLRCYVNGAPTEDRTITASSANGAFTIDTSRMSHGSNSVQLVAELEVLGGGTIKSNSIYFDVAVVTKGINRPIVCTRFDYADGRVYTSGQRPELVTKQFDTYTLNYAVYNPLETPTAVAVYEGDEVVASAKVSFVDNELQLRSNREGERSCKIACGDTTYTYTLQVGKTDLNLTEPTDGLKLHLTAQGRSNSDVKRASWTYNGVTTDFRGFNFGGDGWINGALRHKGDAVSVVNYKPLQQVLPTTNAFAFSIRYKCSEVVDHDAVVVSCIDSRGTGFEITPSEARLITSGNSKLSMKMASDVPYEVTFVSFPQSKSESSEYEKNNSEMVYLYINGVMCAGVQRGPTDSVYQATPMPIKIGSTKATIDVNSIRAYNTFLTDDQVLALYILGQPKVDDLIAEYKQNDVLNSEGDISVESAPAGLRVVIITGTHSSGMPTAIYAAVNNNKKTKFDVSEIFTFVKGGVPEQNFRLIGGCIALQGTSSLAYPTKNYRIYTYDSSKDKKQGQLFVGCDENGAGGTLRESGKWTFRIAKDGMPAGADVNCFCLKADFAESSSSHNTGMARLVHNTLIKAGELTPPQKHVDRKRYDKDVRTTVDGEPCLLFYRGSVDETPKFLGKFNFNNDKSTEDVFGFLGIPGYHDATWVTTKFGGKNPTECWEFLNNDYPMGSFKDSDFDAKASDGTPNWMKVFEARFPDDKGINAKYADGTLKPKYLEPLVKWVHSTDTLASGLSASAITQRKNKFKRELGDYFDIDYLCDYYVFTDMFACCDQRVKNMMMSFFYEPKRDKVLAYMIFYDNDTILGVRNDGRLRYHWDINEETIDTELSVGGKTVYAFAGHDSVLWKNLREQFPDEIKKAYIRIRAKLSNADILRMFNDEQSERFCERVFNVDSLRKYIDPKTKGVSVLRDGRVTTQTYSYLESMQGNRKSHREWFIYNRMALFDAWAATGQYTATDIAWKGNSEAGATLRAVTGRDFYLEFKREGTSMLHKKVQKGEEFVYRYDQVANIGTIFHLYGGQWITKLDLSDWGGFTNLDIPNMPVLEELIMGKEGKSYGLTEFAIRDNLPMLRKLSLNGYENLPSLNLTGCSRLEEVDARGCNSLSSILFGESSAVKVVKLPNNYQTLSLVSLPNITRAGIVFGDVSRLVGIRVENCPKLSGMELLKEILSGNNSLKYVRIHIGSITGDGSELEAWYEKGLGGINSDGTENVSKCKLLGNYQLTKYLDEAVFEKYRERFDELNIRQPQYTVVELDDAVATPAKLSNLDNKTGYKFGNAYKPSAHIATILNARFPCLAKQERRTKGVMSICRLRKDTFLKYDDNEVQNNCTDAAVDLSQGDLMIYEPEYWYKGVNDIRSMKKYFCYAYGVRPDNPDATKFTLEELRNGGNEIVNQKVVVGSTAQNSLVQDSSRNAYRVRVRGGKKVRVPTSGNAEGVIIVREDGRVIESYTPSTNSSYFEEGMYIVLDIPDGAEWCYFSVPNQAPRATSPDIYAVVSNTSNIVDTETDWVHHKAKLVGAFKLCSVNGKVGSGVLKDSVQSNTPLTGRSRDSFEAFMPSRGMEIISYDEYKNIVNLKFVRDGSITSWDHGETTGESGYSHLMGKCLESGMSDNVRRNGTSGGWGFWKVNGISREWVDKQALKTMGYEYFDSGWYGALAGSGVFKRNEVPIFKALRENGETTLWRFVPNHETSVLRVRHEKYMDIVGLTPYQFSGGSNSTFYTTGTKFWNYGETENPISNGDRYHSRGLIWLVSHDRNLTEQAVRPMFTGEIREVKSVQEFINITDFL